MTAELRERLRTPATAIPEVTHIVRDEDLNIAYCGADCEGADWDDAGNVCVVCQELAKTA